MNRLKYFLLAILIFASPALTAQIQLNGSVDFEFVKGGDNSSFITNGIPRSFENFNLGITNLSSFILAPINEHFFFESRVQIDTWGSGKVNKPRVALAALTWDNPDKNYILRFGRFITPFGFYSKRQLSLDQVFVLTPLGYSYFVNISEKRGYWPQAGANTNVEYEEGDVGLSTVYFAGYTNGIGATWEIKEDELFLDAALTNGTPISQVSRSTLPNVAATARLQYNPSIYMSQGISASFGNFMQADPLNASVRVDQDFQGFTQLLLGADTKIAFTFFEIVGEVIYSSWKVPSFQGASFVTTNNELDEFNLSNISGNIDIKFEPPSFTGGFVALRAEHLSFLDGENLTTGDTFSWDNDISRVTAVVGYKLARNLLAKVSFSDQGDFNLDESAFRFQLSAFF